MVLVRNAYAAVMILLSTALAGCAGGDAGASEVPTAGEAKATSDLGAIEGIVLDGEGIPIGGVEVGLVDTGNTTTTDKDGRFVFNGLKAGTVRLVVQKLGFESAAKAVTVVPGEVTEVRITLDQIELTEPFMAVKEGEGLITCAIGLPLVTIYPDALLGICSTILGLNDDRNIEILVAPGTQESYSEIVWEPTNTVFGSALWAIMEFADDDVGDVAGTSPLRFHEDGYDDDIGDEDYFEHFFWAAGGGVNETNPAHSINVIHEQRVTIYFTEFHHMEMPDGFTAIPPQ